MEILDILLIAGLLISMILNIVQYAIIKNLQVCNEKRKLLKYRTSVVFPPRDYEENEECFKGIAGDR